MKEAGKNYLIKTFCRQCHAAVSAKAACCPMCGIARPNYELLNPLEKEYLENPPMVPGKFHEMLDTVNPNLSLGKNFAREIRNYLGNPAMATFFFIAFVSAFAGGLMLLANTLFPLSFMLFWAAMVYLGYDSINFGRAVITSYLVKRLQLKPGMSPYSVHFKFEAQLEKMLQSLQVVINSFFDQDWQNNPDAASTAENFTNAARTISGRIARCAKLSLDTAAIIWRNNVYAIVAMNSSSQDKAIAIGNKIKEAEALIFRYRWLLRMQDVGEILAGYLNGELLEGAPENASYRQFVLDRYFLSAYGPMSEPFAGNFEHVPFEIPFKMRFFFHQQLPPFPLNAEELVKELPDAADLLESIAQVRKLKVKLEEQMVLDCATNAVSEVSALDRGQNTALLEAEDLQRYQLYSKFLDIPRFQTDSQELQNEVDRLKAEVRVALGSGDNQF